MEDLVIRGDKIESAVAVAMEKFKLSRAEIYKIWSIYRKIDQQFLPANATKKDKKRPKSRLKA